MSLKLLSYNIHSGVGQDGQRDLDRIARVICESGADIVALQEVDSRPGEHSASEQMALLSELTNMAAVPGLTIIEESGGYGNLLLTRLPFKWKPALDISFSRREPRSAVFLEVKVFGQWLTIVATHFGLGLRERLFQARKLESALEAVEGPIILMGDLNEWLPFHGALRPLRQVMPNQKPIPTFPARWPFLALDRIWSRPRSLIDSLTVYDTPLSRQASDHLPLIGIVRDI